MSEAAKCPRCGGEVGRGDPAISRRDNETEICAKCAEDEAMFDLAVQREPRYIKRMEMKALERKWLKK